MKIIFVFVAIAFAFEGWAQDEYVTYVNNEQDEESLYDDERDAKLDSLQRVVSELQSSVGAAEQAIAETEEEARLKSIWNKRAKYFNFYYINQELTQEALGGKWESDFAAGFAMGKTFYIPKKPLAGMIKFGIDWTFFDVNFAKYTDETGFFNGAYLEEDYNDYYGSSLEEDVYQVEIGMSVGPSITINPYNHLKVSGYFRVTPSYSMIYANEEINGSYGTFFSIGGAISYKVISVGIEHRWGKTKYDTLLEAEDFYEDYTDNFSYSDGETKWKTSSLRVYLSFRF